MTEPQNLDTFSYASAEDPRLKRFFIRLIERSTGQPYLKWLYEDYRNNPPTNESFWDSAIRRLELVVTYNEAQLVTWPKSGPLVVVSNHPFGVLDGLTICHLVAKIRTDFLVLTNSVLYRADEIKPFLLPIDFTETREALNTNLKSRAQAKAHLVGGGCLVIFPAGGVSTTPTMWHRDAIDAGWKTFTARLITQARAPVAPVYFAGQNSRLFQIASHISMTLRLSLLFKEVHNKIGGEIRVRIGDVIPYDALASITDRYAVMQHLRQATYALGVGIQSPPKPFLKRPKRAPRHPSSHNRGAA